MPLTSHSSLSLKAATCAATLVFLVYLSTMGSGFSEGDHAELQMMPVINGIAHAPGYGSWALMGKVFLLIPGLTPAQQMNLMTVLFATGAVFTLVFLASVWSGSIWLGTGAGLVLGFTRYAWLNASIAEVYAPQTFFVLAVFTLFVLPELLNRPDPWSYWKGACLLGGWAVGYRPDTVLLLGPCLIYVTWRCWRLGVLRGLPVLFTALCMGAAPGLLYLAAADVLANHPANLYNLLRPYYSVCYDLLPLGMNVDARPNADVVLHGNWFERFRWLYSCESVRWFYAATTWKDGLVELRKIGLLSLQQLGPAVLLLALMSWWGRKQAKHVPELLGWCVVGAYFYSYLDLAIMGQEFYYPPVWGFVCCFAALGASRLPAVPVTFPAHWVTRFDGNPRIGSLWRGLLARSSADILRTICVSLILATAVFQVCSNHGEVRRSTSGKEVRFYHQNIQALFQNLPTGSVVLSTWGPLNGLLYAHYVDGLREDVTILDVPLEAAEEACERFSREYPGRPVFIYRYADVIYRFIPASDGQPRRLEEGRIGSLKT